ncbi:unknown [Clostridium sp. CAG:465]|nr:unknown [Clostridium sp. CAG:465]
MYVTKTLENKNLRIYFVEGIRYLEVKAYYNQKGGTYHWKRVYASDSKASPKKNTQEVFKNSGNSKVVIVVEEETNKARKYTVYIEYSVKIEKFSYSPNRIITQEVIDYINKVIENENVYNQKIKEYNALPKCVQDCIPYEDIGYFEEAIYNASKYNKNVYRLDCLEAILKTGLVKNWLSKMDINTLCKDQKTLDLFAIYVAKRLVKFIPSIEKDIFEKRILNIEKAYA